MKRQPRNKGRFAAKPSSGQAAVPKAPEVVLGQAGFDGPAPVSEPDQIKQLTTKDSALVGGSISTELFNALDEIAFNGPSRRALDRLAETAHDDLWDRLGSVDGLSHYEWDEVRPDSGCTFYLDVVTGNRPSSLDATSPEDSIHNESGDPYYNEGDISSLVKVGVVFGRYDKGSDDLDGPTLWAFIDDEQQWKWAD